MSTRGSEVTVGYVELGLLRVPLQRVAVIDDTIGIDDAEDAVGPALERLHAQRVGLGDLARRVDLVVQHDQHAFAARVGRRRHAERVEQIRRAFVAERAGISHGADQHDRLGGPDGQMEKIRQLFERVGARGNHRAGQARVVIEDLVDASRQLHPLIERHGRAGDVGELLRFRPRVALEPRNQLEDFFGAHARAAARGDGAAGRDEAYTREIAVGPGIDAADGTQDEASDDERKDVGFRALNYTVFRLVLVRAVEPRRSGWSRPRPAVSP